MLGYLKGTAGQRQFGGRTTVQCRDSLERLPCSELSVPNELGLTRALQFPVSQTNSVLIPGVLCADPESGVSPRSRVFFLVEAKFMI